MNFARGRIILGKIILGEMVLAEITVAEVIFEGYLKKIVFGGTYI